MMTQGHEYDNRDWAIYRNRKGSPCWWQRFYEAWLVATDRHSLHRAWQRGVEQGSAMEYRRLITNNAYLAEIKAPSLVRP